MRQVQAEHFPSTAAAADLVWLLFTPSVQTASAFHLLPDSISLLQPA